MKRRIKWKGKVIISKAALFTLIIFSLLGIIQFATIAEEAFHVFHGEGAKSVCLDFNLKINDSVQKGYLAAHTVFDVEKYYKNVEEFYTWRELSEKIAGILTTFLLVGVSFLIGYSIKQSR